MLEFDEIIERLPISQRQFFREVCEKDFEGMKLEYYFMELTGDDFLTFMEDSDFSVFHLQQILVPLIKDDPSNIVKIIDLVLTISSLKDKYDAEPLTDSEDSIEDFQDAPTISPKAILKRKTKKSKKKTEEAQYIYEPVELSQDVYTLKNQLHKKELLDIREVAEFTKISVDIIESKLFDQTLLYPFDKKKKGIQTSFKRTDIVSWFNINKAELSHLSFE